MKAGVVTELMLSTDTIYSITLSWLIWLKVCNYCKMIAFFNFYEYVAYFCSLAPSENRSKGSLLCFAQFMEREIARNNRSKIGWKLAMPLITTQTKYMTI